MHDTNYAETLASLEARLRILSQQRRDQELALHATKVEEQRVFSAHTAMSALVSGTTNTGLVRVPVQGLDLNLITGGLVFGGSATATVRDGVTGPSGSAIERPTVMEAVFSTIRNKPGMTRKEVTDALEHGIATASKDVRKLLGTRLGQMVTRKQLIEHNGGLYLHGQELPMDGT